MRRPAQLYIGAVAAISSLSLPPEKMHGDHLEPKGLALVVRHGMAKKSVTAETRFVVPQSKILAKSYRTISRREAVAPPATSVVYHENELTGHIYDASITQTYLV